MIEVGAPFESIGSWTLILIQNTPVLRVFFCTQYICYSLLELQSNITPLAPNIVVYWSIPQSVVHSSQPAIESRKTNSYLSTEGRLYEFSPALHSSACEVASTSVPFHLPTLHYRSLES